MAKISDFLKDILYTIPPSPTLYAYMDFVHIAQCVVQIAESAKNFKDPLRFQPVVRFLGISRTNPRIMLGKCFDLELSCVNELYKLFVV